MRLIALGFLVLFACAFQQSNPHALPEQSRPEKRKTQQETHYEQQQPNYFPPVSIERCIGCFSVEAAQAPAKQSGSYDPRYDTLYRAYLLVTILGVLGAVYGLWLIYRQSKATEKAAEAALKNANAIIRAERPWIFIELSDPSERPREAHIQLTAWNRGRTPAEITTYTCHNLFTAEKDMPPEPKYPNVELMYRKYVPPEKSFPVIDGGAFDCSTSVPAEAWEEMNVQRQRLHFIGHVVYRDLITHEEHETRFCYFLSPNPWVGLVMTGPRNYNQHT